MLGNILLIFLILLLIGAFPTWPHSVNWGYYPSSGLGVIILVVVVLLVLGRIYARSPQPPIQQAAEPCLNLGMAQQLAECSMVPAPSLAIMPANRLRARCHC